MSHNLSGAPTTPLWDLALAGCGSPASRPSSSLPACPHSFSSPHMLGGKALPSKIITDDTKKAMKKILSDIQDGTFAKDFLLDMSPAGRQVHFRAMRKLAAEHPAEEVGKEVRKLYSWNNEEDKLINN